MSLEKVLTAVLGLIVIAIAAALSYRADAVRGLIGCGVGVGLAAVLIGVSAAFGRRARATGSGTAALTAVYGSVLASFAILIGSMIAVQMLWPEVVQPVSLTALALYLVFRLLDALAFRSAQAGAASFGEPSSREKTISER